MWLKLEGMNSLLKVDHNYAKASIALDVVVVFVKKNFGKYLFFLEGTLFVKVKIIYIKCEILL